MMDGKPVPVFTAAQWERTPSAWLVGRRPAEGADQFSSSSRS